LTTALAFLAFVPTSFVGMAQLGIIASGGMVIAFVASITLIPALLKLIPDNQAKIERKLAHKVAAQTAPATAAPTCACCRPCLSSPLQALRWRLSRRPGSTAIRST
jgi:predicted RND superfamily exporter protein